MVERIDFGLSCPFFVFVEHHKKKDAFRLFSVPNNGLLGSVFFRCGTLRPASVSRVVGPPRRMPGVLAIVSVSDQWLLASSAILWPAPVAQTSRRPPFRHIVSSAAKQVSWPVCAYLVLRKFGVKENSK